MKPPIEGLLPHEQDKHLVSTVIYLSRALDELKQLDLRKVPPARRDTIRQMRTQIEDALQSCKQVRKK